MPNIPYSWAAVITLVILLGLAGWEIKHEIGRNATLTSEVANRDASIKRLSDQAKLAEAERKRLDKIISDRDKLKQDSEGRANAGKNTVRVASKQQTDFGRCSAVHVPADIIQRLREQPANRGADGQAIPAVKPAKRVSATYYSFGADDRAGNITAF